MSDVKHDFLGMLFITLAVDFERWPVYSMICDLG